MLAYLNGKYLPRASATISVEDRGFIFGDGVYEVWRVINGQLFETERHLDRLRFGLGELRIALPNIAQTEVLTDIAGRLLRESDLLDGEATLYVEVTRGAAPRAHAFPSAATAPTVYMTVNKLTTPEDLRRRGAKAITLPDIRWARCDLKTLQLLPNVFAKQAAVEAGATDALMIRDGLVTEGSHTNVFAVVGGTLHTHPATNAILPGITRAVVLELAERAGIPMREVAVTERDLPAVDELFLAGTTTDIMPIVTVNEHRIGAGVPGPVTMRLFADLRAALDATARVAGEPRATMATG